MASVNVGPFVLPVEALATVVAIMLATTVGNRAARATGVRVEPTLWIVIGCALLVARVAYIVRYREAYLASPASMLNVRDGGWMAGAGIATCLLALAWLSWRAPAKRRPLLASALAAAAVWAGAALLIGARPASAPRIPDLALPDLAGRPVRLAGFGARPVVLNLWASWCPPCRREMPVLRQAQARHPGVVFVFADQGEAGAVVSAFLASQHLALANVVLDEGQDLARVIGSRGLPTTLFFDAGGRLVDTRAGELSAASLAQRLDELDPAR